MKIDDEFLVSIGLSNLTDEEKNSVLAQIADIFQFRLGEKIVETLSDQQLDEYETINSQNQQLAHEWVKDNVPNYNELGDKVLTDLQQELKQEHHEILGV